jgi:pimeloyl-ACP methyl ester carboxylesterase
MRQRLRNLEFDAFHSLPFICGFLINIHQKYDVVQRRRSAGGQTISQPVRLDNRRQIDHTYGEGGCSASGKGKTREVRQRKKKGFRMREKSLEPLILHMDDVAVPYLLYESSNRHDRTLILLHATGFPPQLWHPVAAALARTHRVYIPYYGDHREADPATGAVDWMVLAGDLARFCKGLNIANPFVVGHSMGATVAAFSQAACGLNADALFLIEPIFLIPDLYYIPFTVSDHPFASKSIKRIDRWRDEADLAQYLQSKALFQRWDRGVLDLYIQYGFKTERDGGIRLACSPEREAALFMGGMKHDPWPVFSEIHCPAHIMEGADSENRPFVDLNKASTRMPQGSYACMPDASHLIPMEKPFETIKRILHFFQQKNTEYNG